MSPLHPDRVRFSGRRQSGGLIPGSLKQLARRRCQNRQTGNSRCWWAGPMLTNPSPKRHFPPGPQLPATLKNCNQTSHEHSPFGFPKKHSQGEKHKKRTRKIGCSISNKLSPLVRPVSASSSRTADSQIVRKTLPRSSVVLKKMSSRQRRQLFLLSPRLTSVLLSLAAELAESNPNHVAVALVSQLRPAAMFAAPVRIRGLPFQQPAQERGGRLVLPDGQPGRASPADVRHD